MLRLRDGQADLADAYQPSDPYGTSLKNHTEGMDRYCSLLSGGRPVRGGRLPPIPSGLPMQSHTQRPPRAADR